MDSMVRAKTSASQPVVSCSLNGTIHIYAAVQKDKMHNDMI